MKKIAYLPLALVFSLIAACGMHSNGIKSPNDSTARPAAEKELAVNLHIKESIKVGDSVILDFTVRNPSDSVKKFLKWQTPFEPLLSKYLDIKNEQGEEVDYKGPMAKRMMPPPASAYQALAPKDSLSARVDLLKGYALTKSGKYTIAYTSENVSGLKVRQQVSFLYK